MESELLCKECADFLEYRGPRIEVIEESFLGTGRCECCGIYVVDFSLNDGIMIQKNPLHSSQEITEWNPAF